jgi:uncharacterized protein involved in exopolysaccharide biosynthesis
MMDRDEISLQEIFDVLWRERWVIMSITFAVAVVVAAIALLQDNKYEATTTISPVSENSASGKLGGMASQFGGLAALAGLSVGGDSNRAESIAFLQSQSLTERYIAENDLLPILFADKWDPVAKKWKVADDPQQPTLWKGNQMFKKIRKVNDDKKTGMVTLTINWTDPALSAQWANGLVKMANDVLRSKAVHESDQHIEYLSAEATKTDVAPVRSAIYSILESEIKNNMLAKGPGDYALKVIDPALAPERKTSPMRSLWVLVGAFGGFLFSLVVVFIRATWRAGAVARPAAR